MRPVQPKQSIVHTGREQVVHYWLTVVVHNNILRRSSKNRKSVSLTRARSGQGRILLVCSNLVLLNEQCSRKRHLTQHSDWPLPRHVRTSESVDKVRLSVSLWIPG